MLSVGDDPAVDHTLWCSCSWWYPATGTENLQVNQGMLQILGTQDSSGNWSSGHLSTWSPTTGGFSQKFGYWEIRFKPSGQAGVLEDFYLISKGDILTNGAYPTNEMDIFEKPQGSTIFLTLHDGVAQDHWRWNQFGVAADFDSSFHTLGFLWSADSNYLEWYLDGELVWQEAKFPDSDMSPMVMTLEMLVGGAFGPPDSTTANPSVFNVDYVRVYSNDPSIPLWSAQQ